jgi:uncharacterized protein YggE
MQSIETMNQNLTTKWRSIVKKTSRYTRTLLSTMMVLLIALLIGACGTKSVGVLESISVTGYGEANGSPDLAHVQLGVSTVDTDIGQAIYDANTAIERITEAIVARGVNSDDIRTANYSVWTEEVYDPQTGMPTGETRYHVDIQLAVTVHDVQGIGGLISAGLDAGVTNIYGIDFTIDDTSALEAEARDLAMLDVQDRAQKLAQGMGVRLGKPIAISEGSVGGIAPTYTYGLKGDIGIGGGGVAAGVPSTVSPGQTTVGMQVTVVFELLP